MKYVRWYPPSVRTVRVVSRIESFLMRLLRLLLPAANPDLESEQARVVEWWLEVDPSNGSANREIGFNLAGAVIAIGPIGDNMGMLTDSSWRLTGETDDAEVRAQFEYLWERAIRTKLRNL